jgi:hypothetical protein
MAAVAALASGLFADANTESEVLVEAKDEIPVSAEFGLAFDSKYMTYGVIDGKDPIVTPSVEISFFDTLYFGVESIFDVTKGNGKHGGYGNRAGEYTTLDSIVGLRHDFELCDALGTLSVDVNYIYEYIRRYQNSMDDTQYVNLELSLGDLWFEPTLAIERDIMADNGTYVNFEVGHTFTLIDGDKESEDPILTFRPSVGQGFGNTLRTKGYFSDSCEDRYGKGFSHGGLMDTSVKGEFEWSICDNLSLSAYIACYDYLFDGSMRDAARTYNRGNSCKTSYNFVGGLALKASF